MDLIITEKPSSSKRIAKALAEGGIEEKKKGKVRYYEFGRGGKEYVCVPAVGHLYALEEVDKDGFTYPVFDMHWKPSYEVKDRAKFTKKYLEVIKEVGDEANSLIGATDLDEEGEVILRNIIKFALEEENAKRMEFSTLTSSDLNDSFEEMKEELDQGRTKSGILRHKLDFLWGVNTSRALINAIDKAGWFKILSIGRVQGPTLKILYNREKAIEEFEPEDYFYLWLETELKGEEIRARNKKKLWEKEEAEGKKKRISKVKIKEFKKRKYQWKPRPAFNLGDLQSEAYQEFGFSPSKTLAIAQNLYSQALISYPRTKSQKLSPSINYKKIIKQVKKQKNFREDCKKVLKGKLKPRQGKKKSPAHPAIHPTGNKPKKLNKDEYRLYKLITKRFLAAFGEPALRESRKIVFESNGVEFSTKAKRTLKKNWIAIYEPFIHLKEEKLPEVEEGKTVEVAKIEIEEKETSPPPRYNQGSIIKEMQKEGIGTKTTRSNILKKLYHRDYIRGKRIKTTELGKAVVEALEKNCSDVLSISLTKEFERKKEKVKSSKKDVKEVLGHSKEVLRKIVEKLKEREDKIGEKLIEGLRAQQVLGECPKCGNNLRIIKSKESGKRFCGCEGYFKGVCDFSAPLPQPPYKIQPTEKKCEHCGYPMVKVFSKNKERSWYLCLNPECPAKED